MSKAVDRLFEIKSICTEWEGKRDEHRQKRDFLNEHNFSIEAQVEDMIVSELNLIIIDLQLALDGVTS